MSFDPITAAMDLGGKLIDRLIPDPAQKSAAALELLKLQQSGELARMTADTDLAKAQLTVDQAEAASGSPYSAAWRPTVGYICAAGLGIQFLVRPIALWGCSLAHQPASFPDLDMGTLMTLLLGMLGLGAMRTVEKVQGVAK